MTYTKEIRDQAAEMLNGLIGEIDHLGELTEKQLLLAQLLHYDVLAGTDDLGVEVQRRKEVRERRAASAGMWGY